MEAIIYLGDLPIAKQSRAATDRCFHINSLHTWSCSARGLSGNRDRSRNGGLLHRLFTLTDKRLPNGGIFSVTLSVSSSFGKLPCRYFLLPYLVETRQARYPVEFGLSSKAGCLLQRLPDDEH